MRSIPVTKDSARKVREAMEACVARGLLGPKREKNRTLCWRYDGVGLRICVKCYRGKRGHKIVENNTEVYELLVKGDLEALASHILPEEEEASRRSRFFNQNGCIEIVGPRSDSRSGATSRCRFTRTDLSPDQERVFETVHRWVKRRSGRLLTLGGYAGTGKSTLVSLLASDVQDSRSIAFCSFTGKAASILGQKLRAAGVGLGPHYCGTIHGLIYRPISDPETGRVIDWEQRTRLDHDLVIVDEASMVSRSIFEDLQGYGVPILAVGDHGQLPPVGDRFNLMAAPDLRLEQVHRQALDNPIIELSVAIRKGHDPMSLEIDDPRLNRLSEARGDACTKLLRRLFRQAEDAEDTVVLCYRNRTRVELNRRIRDVLGFEGVLETGDTVICLRNSYFGPVLVANGMRGRVESVRSRGDHWIEAVICHADDGYLLSDARILHDQFGRERTFDDFTRLPFKAWSWSHVGLLYDHGYALTVHKAQGSQFSRVVLFVERTRYTSDEHFARWLYTGVTRSSDELWLVGG